MADEPLRSLHRDIEADEAEMSLYRGRLAGRLETVGADRKRRALPLASGAAAVAMAIAALVFLLPRWTEHRVFPQTELVELEALAANAPSTLVARARALVTEGQPQDRLNALMFVCLTERDEGAAPYAAEGLEDDPRPEFRFFYLEFLLDHADEYLYNEERIEQLMDRESDRGCLRLYRTLLDIAT